MFDLIVELTKIVVAGVMLLFIASGIFVIGYVIIGGIVALFKEHTGV